MVRVSVKGRRTLLSATAWAIRDHSKEVERPE